MALFPDLAFSFAFSVDKLNDDCDDNDVDKDDDDDGRFFFVVFFNIALTDSSVSLDSLEELDNEDSLAVDFPFLVPCKTDDDFEVTPFAFVSVFPFGKASFDKDLVCTSFPNPP